jgi:hypothetical protein
MKNNTVHLMGIQGNGEFMRINFDELTNNIDSIFINYGKKTEQEVKELDDVVEIGIALGIIKEKLDHCYYLEFGDNEDVFFMYLDLCVALWKQYYNVVNKQSFQIWR